MMNPWNINSFYDLQYFNCPSCIFKDPSKQEMVYHVYDYHPESIVYLVNIKDDSLIDVICPWNIKKEEMVDDIYYDNHNVEEDTVDPSMVEVCIKSEDAEQFDNKEQIQELKISQETNKGNIKKFSCTMCIKSFCQKAVLKTHIKTVHDGVKDYKCNSCEKVFGQASNLRTHIKNIHEKVKVTNVNNLGNSHAPCVSNLFVIKQI